MSRTTPSSPSLALPDRKPHPRTSSEGRSSPLRSGRSSASSPTNTYGVDPPRPPREGQEWVWFPAGYWAERDVAVAELPLFSRVPVDLRRLRWRPRHGRGSIASGSGSRQWSPHLMHIEKQPSPNLPLPSPYMSEKAQVQSLQHPDTESFSQRAPIVGLEMFPRGVLTPPVEAPTPGTSGDSTKNSKASSKLGCPFRAVMERCSLRGKRTAVSSTSLSK
jgi:hypothetical protein